MDDNYGHWKDIKEVLKVIVYICTECSCLRSSSETPPHLLNLTLKSFLFLVV